MIDRVIFDADGTLLDSMPVWMTAGIRYLKTLGLIPEPDLPQKLLPLSMFETASYLKNTYHLLYCEDMIVRQINELIMDSYENTVPLKDGVLDLLEGLTQLSIPLTVATATDRPAIEAAFRRLGIFDLFSGIFTATEVSYGKDHPDIYLAAAAGGCAHNIWVFEDSLYAALTAKNIGFNLAAVFDESGNHNWTALSSVADFCIENASDFRKFLCLLC